MPSVPESFAPEQLTPLYWAREKTRCEQDFEYLSATYLHIKSKHVIGFPTLKLNRVQRYLYGKMVAQQKRTGWIRQIWGKSRQVGASTLCRALSFQHTAFKSHRNAFLCTHDEPTSYELFDIDKTFYTSLPIPLQPTADSKAKARMVFSGRKSKVLVGHARNMNVGASQTNHFLHLTEVPRYPNAEMIQSSLLPTLSSAKGVDFSVAILEGTSFFGGDWFKQFAEAARAGETEWEFHFIPWFWHEDYQVAVPAGFRPTSEERDLMARFGLALPQIVWRRNERADYKSNPSLFEQNFPYSWESSWALPKGALRVFDEDTIAAVCRELRPGTRFTPTSAGLEPQLGGLLEVWQGPEPGIYFDVGVDIAEGRTEDADWTVIEVVRRDTLEQVAECRVHMDPASPEFYSLVYWIGMAYNAAQIVPDITGGWGSGLLSELQRRSYPNIWHWRRRDDARERVSTRLGFLYTRRDKAILVANAVALAKRGDPSVHSDTLKQELRNFLNVGLDEWGASPGEHDDAANAWMMALLGARDERIEATTLPEEKKPETPPAYLIHDVAADLEADDKRGELVLAPWRV